MWGVLGIVYVVFFIAKCGFKIADWRSVLMIAVLSNNPQSPIRNPQY
jgi:hypothetical protein